MSSSSICLQMAMVVRTALFVAVGVGLAPTSVDNPTPTGGVRPGVIDLADVPAEAAVFYAYAASHQETFEDIPCLYGFIEIVGGTCSEPTAPAPGTPPEPTTTTTTTSTSSSSTTTTTTPVANPDPGPPGDGANLAPNPSFETDPAISYFTHGDAEFAWASDAAHEGSRSLRVTSTQVSTSLARWLSKTDVIAAVSGGTYDASVMFRTYDVADRVVLTLNFWDSNGVHLGSTASPALSGTNPWTEVSVSGVAPANAASVRVEFRLVGPGTLYADNVSVTRRAAATTPPTTTSAPFAGPGTVGHAAGIPGVHAPAQLTNYSGDFITSRDGEVIRGLDIDGVLYVRHRDVVVEDVRVRGIHVDVDAYPQASVSVRWATIGDPKGRTDGTNAIGNGNYSVYRSDLFGAVDLLKLREGYGVVEESWLHEGIEWESDPGQDGGRSHVDFLQTSLQGNVTQVRLINNYFDAWVFRQPQQVGDVWRNLEASYTATGVISLFQHNREFQIDDVLVQGNVFNGDAYAYFHVTHDADDPAPSNVRFLDNVIYRNYDTFGKNKLAGFDSPETIVWDGNTDQYGNRVAVSGTRAR